MSACELAVSPALRKVLNIELSEHFDYRSIHSFRRFCRERFDCETEVIIDMAATRYIDSSGVALLMCLYQWIKAPLVTVIVVNCAPAVETLLRRSICKDKIVIY